LGLAKLWHKKQENITCCGTESG